MLIPRPSRRCCSKISAADEDIRRRKTAAPRSMPAVRGQVGAEASGHEATRGGALRPMARTSAATPPGTKKPHVTCGLS